MLISVGGPSVRRASAGQTTPPPAPQSASHAPASTFADALDARLRELAGAAQDVQQKTWLAQLTSFYVARRGAPVWISDKGWTERGRQALAELENAESYGLDQPALRIPVLPAAPMSQAQKVAAEIDLSRAIIAYAYQARGGRIDPQSLSLWLDRTPDEVYATAVMIDMIAAADAGAALRAMHPQSEAFQMLRAAYASMREEAAHPRSLPASDVLSVPGPTLKIGDWHPDVAIVRRRLDAPGRSGFETKFDEALAGVIDDKLSDAGVRVRWGRIDDKVRAFLNLPPPPPSKTDIMQVQANMERWRWLPRTWPARRVEVRIAEYRLDLLQENRSAVTHDVIVGAPRTPTHAFNAQIESVTLNPDWDPPDTITFGELLPRFRRNPRAAAAEGFEAIDAAGQVVDAASVDWNARPFPYRIRQRPGAGNALGFIRFNLPNPFAIYLHDTPSRGLFNRTHRALSHGCVRVREPEKFAQLLLQRDVGWSAQKVSSVIAASTQPNNTINLKTRIPVHMTYFTAVVEPDGKLRLFNDVYGHEPRIALGMEGKAHLIPREKEDTGPVEAVGSLAEAVAPPKSAVGPKQDWARKAFGNY